MSDVDAFLSMDVPDLTAPTGACPFPRTYPFDYPKFEAVTAPDGIRVYIPPDGIPVPSVTTILGTLPKPGIDAWRAAVGDKEADRVTKEATTIGSSMHDMLEGYMSAYLQGRPDEPPKNDYERLALRLATEMRTNCLPDLNEVWGIEEALYCPGLYAGRCDLIGVYARKPSIIDYKTSRKPKPEKWIINYKLQIAAYAVAHETMFDEDVITQGVILISIRPNQESSKTTQRFILDTDELHYYKQEWLKVVENFYTGF